MSAQSQRLWNQLVAEFRQACLLRREGKEDEAARVLEGTLPRQIASWSREDKRSADEKRAALETMFESERATIDSYLFAHEAMATRLTNALVPALRQQLSEDIQRAFSTVSRDTSFARPLRQSLPPANRVRFDDIPAVIDTLLAQQRQADYSPQPVFCQ